MALHSTWVVMIGNRRGWQTRKSLKVYDHPVSKICVATRLPKPHLWISRCFFLWICRTKFSIIPSSFSHMFLVLFLARPQMMLLPCGLLSPRIFLIRTSFDTRADRLSSCPLCPPLPANRANLAKPQSSMAGALSLHNILTYRAK